jgi:hypothetical protein
MDLKIVFQDKKNHVILDSKIKAFTFQFFKSIITIPTFVVGNWSDNLSQG